MKNHLSRNIFIDCCKDRTLTYRHRSKKPFNGVAIPVFSVNDELEAKTLLLMVSRVQYVTHPKLPGQTWYKMTLDGELDFKPYLDFEDLKAVTSKLASRYELMVKRLERSNNE